MAYRIAEMRKAAMLFNPASGRRRERRLAVVEEVQAALKHAGVETSPTATRSHEEAVQEVARAVASGFDTVVVCGCNFPNCPRTTIYEASERDFRVVLAIDAISGLDERGMEELGNIGVRLR